MNMVDDIISDKSKIDMVMMYVMLGNEDKVHVVTFEDINSKQFDVYFFGYIPILKRHLIILMYLSNSAIEGYKYVDIEQVKITLKEQHETFIINNFFDYKELIDSRENKFFEIQTKLKQMEENGLIDEQNIIRSINDISHRMKI